jgi:hypothetical protein
MGPSPLSGLLYSQIGYDLRAPMRAIVRSTDRHFLDDAARFWLQDADSGAGVLSGSVSYWGECWQSHWWIADFSALKMPGRYRVQIDPLGLTSEPFPVAEHLLWDETICVVALDQFEERARQARYGKGWKDCGSDWREVSSHAPALIGLTDLLNVGYEWLGQDDTRRLVSQVIHGCDYLIACQSRAAALGYPAGVLLHELPNYPHLIPADQGQSVVALARAARLIYEIDPERSMTYLAAAVAAYEYLIHRCQPYGPQGFSALAHGAPPGYVPQSFMTADLLLMAWGGLELARAGRMQYKDDAIRLARQVLRRQVPITAPEGKLYGHFYTFDDCTFTEKAFAHHHVGHDTGTVFGHYLAPLIELCQSWPEHPEAALWREAVHNFAYGYLLPACRQNPFFLLPNGYYSGEGLLTFAGPWHGFNVCYAYAASFAAQLELFFGDRQFRDIAAGNLQWIAGLNAGHTRQSFEGSVLWKETPSADVVLPHSHIEGIGRRAVKTWSGIRGAIGSGFCTNLQFQLVVDPRLINDGPWHYSDEDWIPHAGGWVSALAYLRQTMRYRA